jgi:predicted NBD/HSP70 family sugar kinase
MKFSASASLMRRLNRSAILDLIRAEGTISRTQIGRRLSLSLPTVMRIVDDLIEVGLVMDGGATESTGGRPRSLLKFNGRAAAVVGIDLGGTQMFGTVSDLGGNIQIEKYLARDGEDGPANLAHLFELIDHLLAVPRPSGQTIRGIGIGAPGITQYNDGIVTWAPSLNWRDLPLKKLLSERYNLPVFVENDVNLAALGEYGFGSCKGAASLVLLAVGTGIGAGIVIDRQIYRGHHQSAGEIGYLPPDSSYLNQRYEGFGALESLASVTGVAQRARQALQQMRTSLPADITGEEVLNAAHRGEAWAQAVVAETASYLSLAVAAISTLIDPEVVILGGGVAPSADLLIPLIQGSLAGVIPVIPLLKPSSLGFRAAVMGAIMMVLDATTEHVSIQRIS